MPCSSCWSSQRNFSFILVDHRMRVRRVTGGWLLLPHELLLSGHMDGHLLLMHMPLLRRHLMRLQHLRRHVRELRREACLLLHGWYACRGCHVFEIACCSAVTRSSLLKFEARSLRSSDGAA